jgi:hypothetical protein
LMKSWRKIWSQMTDWVMAAIALAKTLTENRTLRVMMASVLQLRLSLRRKRRKRRRSRRLVEREAPTQRPLPLQKPLKKSSRKRRSLRQSGKHRAPKWWVLKSKSPFRAKLQKSVEINRAPPRKLIYRNRIL